MTLLPLFRVLVLGTVWTLAAGLVAPALPCPAAEPIPPQKQIADLERQIKDLSQRLESLRKREAIPVTPVLEGTLPADWVKGLNWRSIGPATMGGRITALAVYEADPTTFWVATASGGLLKTVNNGVTFEHQFDREATVSIGDVCVAPSDRNLVWVGTGEGNPRNSVSYGDGVYKSTDGGKTWKNMGLKGTYQVGKIAIHPKDPNTVYVGALGRLYGPNDERGLFKTTDGGQSWKKVLFVDDKTGVIDVQMDPSNPDTLLVATWERQRDGFDSHPGTEMPPAEGYDRYDPIKKWGPGSGIYRTTDGGQTFHKVTRGLPGNALGRIGLDYYRKDPKVVYAVVDCEKTGMGLPPVGLAVAGEKAEGGVRLTRVDERGSGAKAGLKVGDLVTSVDGQPVKDLETFTEGLEARKAGDKVKLAVKRDKETKELVAVVETRAEPEAAARFAPPAVYLGVQVDPGEDGARVGSVTAGGPSAKAGLKEGDLLTAIDKKPIRSALQIFEVLRERKPGDKVELDVLRGGASVKLTAELEKRPGTTGERPKSLRPYAGGLGGQRENVQHQQGPDSHEYGGIYRSADGGETWTRVNSLNPRPMYFSQVRVDPSDENRVYVAGVALYRSNSGGKKFTSDGGNLVHSDHHALWIDPRDGRHMILGADGGCYVSYDRMAHWDFLNHAAIGQFYHVALDNRRPYRAYGGLQDNGSWGGPTQVLRPGGPVNEDWFLVGGGDGFVCRVDPTDPDVVYWESQDGNVGRRNLRTGQRASIRPRQADGATPYRFNWNTPYILSSHNPKIFYSAGNVVFRSVKQGDDLKVISPEITRTKRGSGSALAESPRDPDVLWVGSDDGYLWVTRNGGKDWSNVTDRVGLPGPRWVASIEPSRFADGRAYVAFDAHRSDDDEPYVFVTEDFGQTWKSLRANLPTGSTRVLREDLVNPDLLFLGTEFGVWASTNRGGAWTKVNNNLPTVAVHELALHPTAGEMVAATHGRSLWVVDVSALRQLTAKALEAPATLFRPQPAVHWRAEPARGAAMGTGSRRYTGQNPPAGAPIAYSLTRKADKVEMRIVDFEGRTVATPEVKNEPGLHRTTWNLTRARGPREGTETGGKPRMGERRPGGGGMGGAGPGAGGRRSGVGEGRPGGGGKPAGAVVPGGQAVPAGEGTSSPEGKPGEGKPIAGKPGAAGRQMFGMFTGQDRAPAGTYRVILTVDGEEFTQPLVVENDPVQPEFRGGEQEVEDD